MVDVPALSCPTRAAPPLAAGHLSLVVRRALDFGALPAPPLPSPPGGEPHQRQQQEQEQQRAGSGSPRDPEQLAGSKRRREARPGAQAGPPSQQREQQRLRQRDPLLAACADSNASTQPWSEACDGGVGDALREDASSQPRPA